MAIIIRNIGSLSYDLCKYELRINDKVITQFEHHRCNGLAECLRSAANAAEQQADFESVVSDLVEAASGKK